MAFTKSLLICALAAALPAIIQISAIAQEKKNTTETAPLTGEELYLIGAIDYGREIVSQRCANCHATKPNEKLFAPTLFNLFGRKAGSVEGFPYTPKIKLLDLVWTPKSLNTWLKTTSTNTPDIRMRHVGIARDDEREAVIAYLKTLSN